MDLVNAFIDYKYEDDNINKYIKIYKRSKNKRIKNKMWVRIFHQGVKERKVIKLKDVVILDIEVYNDLTDTYNTLQFEINKLKVEQDKVEKLKGDDTVEVL